PRRRRGRGPVQSHRPGVRGSKTAIYMHAYAESNGFLTLLSDGERLTGAYALGPEAGGWLHVEITARPTMTLGADRAYTREGRLTSGRAGQPAGARTLT